MASLIVRKENGQVLFDTNLIVYGLVKSAYLAADETWPRKYLRSSNLDPNQGGSYEDSFRTGDQMFSITVSNARSPICFITGKGCLQGTYRSGDTIKFLYSGGGTGTKAYVFDLMGELAGSPPYLKTRNQAGAITFNSLQVPLNVVNSIQAPAPSTVDQFNRYIHPFTGGSWQSIRWQSATTDPVAHYVVDIPLTANKEYAAFLNFSRGATGFWAGELTASNAQAVGMSEGAYGRVGGISFMFGPAGATTNISISSISYSIPGSVGGLPTDRYPTALVVETTILPFPYN